MRHLKFLAVAVALAAALPALAADSATKYYETDATLTVNGTAIRVLAGSSYQSLTTTATAIQLTLGAGETVIMHTAGPNPIGLETGGVLAACNVLQDRDNQLVVYGPGNFEVVPSNVPCSTTDYSTNQTPLVAFSNPTAGQTLVHGHAVQLFWSTSGRALASVRLSLSIDGGKTYPTEVAANLFSNGYYNWTVPDMATAQARLRLEGFDQGRVVTMALSPIFAIEGTAPVVAPTPAPVVRDYSPSAQLLGATSVDDGVGYVAPVGGLSDDTLCPVGLRVKGTSSSAVYYCGRDGKRHAFPNQRVHDSWFVGFTGVVTVTDARLAAVMLGENVTYRPGERLLKLATDPKVYAVAKGGVLRWVETESAATDLYGADWNTKVDDVPDTFFTDYTVGESIK